MLSVLLVGLHSGWYRCVYKMRVLLRLGETLLRGLFIKKRKKGKERSGWTWKWFRFNCEMFL